MNASTAVLLISLLGVAGCSSGSSSQSAATVVFAQTGYSNASLTGTYAFQLVSPYNGSGPFYDEVGTITFDGAGKVTAGSGTAYFALNSTPCNLTYTGTYMVQASGSGTGTLSSTSTTTGCLGLPSAPIAFQVAGSGSTVQFASASSSATFAGSAVKQ